MNVLSGVISTLVFVAATTITSGNAAKFFTVALALAVSTTLLSYLGIFPAAWVLRRRLPEVERPYRAPAVGPLTVVSTAWIVFCTVQILFPGLGAGWFTADFRPTDDWAFSERWTYLLTELVPLLVFAGLAVAFWAVGRRETRAGGDGGAQAPERESLERA